MSSICGTKSSPRSSAHCARWRSWRFHLRNKCVGNRNSSVSINFACRSHIQIPLGAPERVACDIRLSKRLPPLLVAVMCAASPTWNSPEALELDGPTVRVLQAGKPQRNPAFLLKNFRGCRRKPAFVAHLGRLGHPARSHDQAGAGFRSGTNGPDAAVRLCRPNHDQRRVGRRPAPAWSDVRGGPNLQVRTRVGSQP